MTEIIDSLRVEETSELSLELTTLLEKVTWGTEGARYKLVDIGPTLQHLPNPTYITLAQDGKLIGLRLYLEKEAQCNGQTLHSFYHSFFAIDPEQKGRGYGKILARSTVDLLRQKLSQPGIIYCHVERENLRSLKIAESLGYRHAGQFCAMTFSRFFPKGSVRLRKLAKAEVSFLLRRLSEQYTDHALTDFPLSLSPESYYVLSEGDRILSGLQVEPQHWQILSLAGAGGAVAMHALPYLPLLRDLFNPRQFEFLKFGNVFYQKDHPELAFELMGSVLALHKRKTAMMFWDKKSPVYQQLAGAGSFGVLNALTETPVEIMALFEGLSDGEISNFCWRPKVISPIDL
jgi:ribosomal protein S18 acetylase RimI-like enzyme